MAWTVNDKDAPMIELIPDGSTDFVWATYFPFRPEGIKIDMIHVKFSAINDVILIRNGRLTGTPVFEYTSLDGSSKRLELYKGLFRLCIKNSEQTFGTPANVKIIIQEAA